MTKKNEKLTSNRLFKADEDWQNNACLNYGNGWYAYIEGYKRAADLLAERVVRTKRDQDLLVYPIVFLYRQYVELLLKHIIMEGSNLLDLDSSINERHKLPKLWTRCREIIETVWTKGDRNILDEIEGYITDLDNIDPSSTAFRYPTDLRDNPSLPGLSHINIRNVKEVIENKISILEGAGIGISEYLSCKREMDYEMSKIYGEYD